MHVNILGRHFNRKKTSRIRNADRRKSKIFIYGDCFAFFVAFSVILTMIDFRWWKGLFLWSPSRPMHEPFNKLFLNYIQFHSWKLDKYKQKCPGCKWLPTSSISLKDNLMKIHVESLDLMYFSNFNMTPPPPRIQPQCDNTMLVSCHVL